MEISMQSTLKALSTLRPGARWSFDSSKPGLSGLTWLDLEQLPPTQAEVDAEIAKLEGPPSKAQRIADVLVTTAEGRDRTTVQLAILIGEMVLAPYAAQLYGVTLEIALMGVYARNKTYRLCKDAETAIEAIEDES